MGQVTIYLDKNTEEKLNNAVENSGVSKSKWISKVIQEKTSISWPEKVKKLAGSWGDLPTAEEIRADMGIDVERESL